MSSIEQGNPSNPESFIINEQMFNLPGFKELFNAWEISVDSNVDPKDAVAEQLETSKKVKATWGYTDRELNDLESIAARYARNMRVFVYERIEII